MSPEHEAEFQGFEPGTDPYKHAVASIRVERCLSLKSLSSCSECVAAEFCRYRSELYQLELQASYWRGVMEGKKVS